jgi:hypothetical protein
MVWAQDNSATQKEVVHQHYLELMDLRSQIRQYKMEISDLQAKLGATVLFGEDRDEYNRLMEYDMEHLMTARSSLLMVVQYLSQHLSDLNSREKGDVEEALVHPE